MRAGLLTSTYLDAMGVTQLKQSYQQHAMDRELQDRMYVSNLWKVLAWLSVSQHLVAFSGLSARIARGRGGTYGLNRPKFKRSYALSCTPA